MANKALARNKFDFKSRVLNTNDNLIVKIFRSIIILFGFLLSFFYSFFKLDNFYFFRRIFFLFYYFAKSFIDRKNCSIINKKIKKNDVFLDIGSAYGFYPYFLNKLNLNININAVEPDQVCLKYLRDLKIFKNKNNKIFEICAFSSKKKVNSIFQIKIVEKIVFTKIMFMIIQLWLNLIRLTIYLKKKKLIL